MTLSLRYIQMYFLSSLSYLLSTCLLFSSYSTSSSSLSPPHPRLPAPPPLLILSFTVFFFLLSPFLLSLFSLYFSPSLSPLYSTLLYSTLSLFGNAALLLALLFPIYASLLKCPFFFPPFSLSLIGWFPFLLFFFSLDRLPPLPFSFLIRPLLGPIRPLYATHPLLPLVGSNFPFRSPLFPPISFVSLLSSLF